MVDGNGVVIDASGNDLTPGTSDGLGSRIFRIDDDDPGTASPVTIRKLILTGGDTPLAGGAILSHEPLTIDSSTISGNASKWEGGGVWGAGNVSIVASTISHNSVERLQLISDGGGVWAGGDLTVISSTISGNTADFGSGVRTLGSATLISSTIAKNSGYAVVVEGESLTVWNSIVAGNNSPDLLERNWRELYVVHSLIGDNLYSSLREAPIGSPDANGNLIGDGRQSGHGVIDPRLGPLTDNGGVTPTHALLPGSPAIDMGDPTAMAGVDGVPAFDQRGEPYSRVVNGRMDMGAFERGIAGDANGDRKVDFDDFLALAANFGTGLGWHQGNFDGSEDGVQFADFVALAENFGYEEPGSIGIPEARGAPVATFAMADGSDVDQASQRRRSWTELADDLLAGAFGAGFAL